MLRRTPIEDSDIRSAHRNAVGGKRDKCRHGKPCSAACINAEMVCLVDLPEPIAISVDKIRDYINSVKNKMVGGTDAQGRSVVGEFQLLKTPKEAAEWLLAHKEELATWGIDDLKLQSVLKYHPKVITVGVEPGAGRTEGKAIVPQLFPETSNIPSVIPSGKGNKPSGEKGSFHDQMTKVNEYKLALETSKYLAKVGPEVFGKTYNDRVGHLVGTGFNADRFLKELEESGNLGNGIFKAGGVGSIRDATRHQWDQGLRDISLNFGVPFGTTTSGLNPSGLWKPTVDHGQFGELFKAAEMGDKAGPFAKQDTWVSYAGNAVRNKFDRIFEEAKPGLVMITQNANKDLAEAILLSAGNSKTSEFKFETLTKNGKEAAPVKALFAIKDYSDGNRGVVVSTNHIGSGWKGQQDSIRPLIIQTAKFMRETGRSPSESEMEAIRRETLKVPGNRPVTSVTRLENPGDRILGERMDKEIKGVVKEGKEEDRELAKQEKIAKNIEMQATKIMADLQREGKFERTPRVNQSQSTPFVSRPSSQPGKLAQNLINLPNGSFSADNIWKALEEHNQGKKKKDWVPVFQDILRSVRDEQGGFVTKGPKADEARRRAQEAALLPKSSPSFNEQTRQPWAQPSTRWDFKQKQPLGERPSILG